MRPPVLPLLLLAPLSAISISPYAASRSLAPRHDDDMGGMDMSHTAHDDPPLLELNETEILVWHAPDPPSFYGHDFLGERSDAELARGGKSWLGLMGVHVVLLSISYFMLLPLAIALRGAHHPWHAPVSAAYLITGGLGSAAGTLYKKLTPNLYEGSAHGFVGHLVLFSTFLLSLVDAWALLRRLYTFLRTPDKSVLRLWRYVLLGKDDSDHTYGLVGLGAHPESYALQEHIEEQEQENDPFITSPPHSASSSAEWARSHHHHHIGHGQRASMADSDDEHSETTLHENHLHMQHEPEPEPLQPGQRTGWRRALWITFLVLEHVLVVFAAIACIWGNAVYMGWCRAEYVNGCAAHMIKGGIFLFYGILTFARYCGAFSQLGWAWNTPPSSSGDGKKVPPSAEMIESFVVFFYGATNTWMERFGSAPGDPYSTKQIQHISIAVMFFFAGATGMALESRFVRRMLSAAAVSATGGRREEDVERPTTGGRKWSGSFNVFPAVCIGITGLAMSAHHQTYLFQVQIHALWGLFLSLFAVFRILTYVFLWLHPPTSPLPSRPPTEALAAFTLACGGLTFILSTEQITFAAMRTGRDDVMMVLNLVVGVVCGWFTWVLAVLAIRGWAVGRQQWRAAREQGVGRPSGEEGVKEVQA